MAARKKQGKALFEWIDEARERLGLSWEELAQRANVHRDTLRNIAQGGKGYPKTIRNIEAALGWTLGSIQAIKDEGEPTELTDPLAQPLPTFAAPAATDDPAVQLRALRIRMGATAFWREIGVMQAEEATLSGSASAP